MKIKNATFITDCTFRPQIGHARNYIVQNEIKVVLRDEEDTPLTITIPKGFTFDGASIPRAFWRVIGAPWEPRFIRGALLHDYLYRNNYKYLSRKEADKVFAMCLMRDNVGYLKRTAMYYAVRLFGRSSYHKCTSSS